MVAPLIAMGLLAAAGGQLAVPHYQNYAARQRGRYAENAGLLSPELGPEEFGRAAMGAGLMDPQAFQEGLRRDQQAMLDRQNALERASIAVGPSYARLAFDQQQWGYQVNQAAQETQRQNDWLNARGYEVNPFTPKAARDAALATEAARFGMTPAQRELDTLQTEAGILAGENAILEGQFSAENQRELARRWAEDPVYGQFNMPSTAAGGIDWANVSQALGPQSEVPTLKLSGENQVNAFKDIGLTGQALDTLDDAISFVEGHSQAWNPGAVRQLEERLISTVMPALQQMANAGTLDQAEYERQAERLNIRTWRDGPPLDKLSAIRKELESLYELNANVFENSTTGAQRRALGYERRKGGTGSSEPPPGTVEGVAQ